MLLSFIALVLAVLGGGLTENGEGDVMCLKVNHSALLMEPSSKCVNILKQFSHTHSSFLDCILTHSHPTCMCEACWPHYNKLNHIYDTIIKYDSNASVTIENFNSLVQGHHCTVAILYSDRLHLITASYNFAVRMWDKAACTYCIKNCTGGENCNGSRLIDSAKEFYRKLENVTKCMGRAQVISEEITAGSGNSSFGELLSSPVHESNVTLPNVCYECREHYQSLLETFKTIRDDAESKGWTVCADIMDHINKTRLQWGTIYNCERKAVNIGLIVGLGILASLSPILFYLGAKLCGLYCEVRESRLKLDIFEPKSPMRKTFPNYGTVSIQRRKETVLS